MVAAARLRKGAVNSARGAASLLREALTTARACGAGGPERAGLVLMRADSAFYSHNVIAAARREGACFSITARMDAAVKRAIGAIGEDAWTAIRYPNAIWDDEGNAGSPTPRSPRSASPRSPPGASATTFPPG
ncbi:hypothetical protein SAMN05661080_04483 [Modestobacter sp. DSM 44400]|nr:hypothetical protein SAMN05661080_04483 [Modestobacter sp. DSM 44400]